MCRQFDIFPVAKTKVEIVNAISQTNLEWTGIQNGLFTDFYVAPKVKSYLNPFPLVIDIQGNAAGIPGTGNESIVFTHTSDVSKYVAELVLDSKPWNKTSTIIGDKITWNEFVKIAENVKGTKFEVTYDSIDTFTSPYLPILP
jgi:hypothetical protein